MLPGPIGASAAHGALEQDGLIRRDAGGRWTAVRPPARTGLGGEKAEPVERLGDWPVPQRLIEALAPETALPAAAATTCRAAAIVFFHDHPAATPPRASTMSP